MDLKDRFDLATSGGPTHAPLEERLQHGRRAGRRRAAGRALGTLVVASTVVVGATTLSTGQDRATEPATPAVASPSPTPPRTPTQTFAVVAPDKNWEEDEWARMNPRSGEVTVRSGVAVADSLDPAVPVYRSVALDLTRDGERLFVLLVRRAGIVTSSWDEPAGRTLREFTADEQDPVDALPVAAGSKPLGADLPLVGYDDGELFTVEGASVVRVVADPIEGWCTSHATAAVEVRYSGETYFAALGDGNCESLFIESGVWDVTLDAAVARFRAGLEERGELEEAPKQADTAQTDPE